MNEISTTLSDVKSALDIFNQSKDLFGVFKNVFSTKKSGDLNLNLAMVPPKRRCKGLIAFVSMGKGSSSARQAIEYHYHGSDGQSKTNTLQRVWLLHSPGSFNDAKNIREFIENETSIEHCVLLSLDRNEDIYIPESIKSKIDGMVEGLKDQNIICEDIAISIAGGSVSVSLAMFTARLIHGFQLEIMIPNQVDAGGRALPEHGSKPYEITLNQK